MLSNDPHITRLLQAFQVQQSCTNLHRMNTTAKHVHTLTTNIHVHVHVQYIFECTYSTVHARNMLTHHMHTHTQSVAHAAFFREGAMRTPRLCAYMHARGRSDHTLHNASMGVRMHVYTRVHNEHVKLLCIYVRSTRAFQHMYTQCFFLTV